MNRSSLASLALSLLLLVTGSALTSPAMARQRRRQPQQQTQVASISQLRQQVRRMAALELDDATPLEVRDINRVALSESRARLRELLQTRLDGLLAYRAEFEDSLTPELSRSLTKSVNELVAEINALGAQSPARRQKAPRVGNRQPRPPVAPNADDTDDEPPAADAGQTADADAQDEGGGDLTIHAPKQVSARTVQVTLTNTNPEIKKFTLYRNGKPVSEKELSETDITIKSGGQRDVHFALALDKDKTNTLTVMGLTDASRFVSESAAYRIKHVSGPTLPPTKTKKKAGPGDTAGGKKGGKGADGEDSEETEETEAAEGRITITKPEEDAIFADAKTAEVRFTVAPPKAGSKEQPIRKVNVVVLNNGVPVKQPSSTVDVKYDGDTPQETAFRARIGEGDNVIKIFSEYVEGEPRDLVQLKFTCDGDACGGQPPTRIKITKPEEGTVYSNVGSVEVDFTVEPPAANTRETAINNVSFNVLNNGRALDQGEPTPRVKVENGAGKARARFTDARRRRPLYESGARPRRPGLARAARRRGALGRVTTRRRSGDGCCLSSEPNAIIPPPETHQT